MECVRTSIIGRPRRLSGQRHGTAFSTCLYTLNYEEPVNAVSVLAMRVVRSDEAASDMLRLFHRHLRWPRPNVEVSPQSSTSLFGNGSAARTRLMSEIHVTRQYLEGGVRNAGGHGRSASHARRHELVHHTRTLSLCSVSALEWGTPQGLCATTSLPRARSCETRMVSRGVVRDADFRTRIQSQPLYRPFGRRTPACRPGMLPLTQV
jgi:hypothetical protein